ncbi:cation-translocating P-type ATPase [Cuneatibacter caecimuris]|uniref:Ca2+-transporting ATPase n=1 Tax=Cuneatibacter caecimuris TaxID=1796618 RepID=A0A4Q7PRA8_9FIRM|nr:cation-translocating P-type ATPase [Cuneatibacter caecimuris]RZT02876.1 Ca2+-transporting ATPase [Cuneatibacter caecimuris]
MKEWYQKTSEEALTELQATREGLTEEKARALLAEKGENALQEGKKKKVWQVFLEQFCDLLVIILIAAAVISMFSGNLESTIVIIAVIIMNAVLGTVQHQKAEKSLDSLKSMSAPTAKVMRGGRKTEIPSREVVPGDILLLEAGDLVVADGRILNNYSLQVNESSLTGESTNVDKTEGVLEGEMPLADRTNMVYSGSLVTYGRAVAVVTDTGMGTEIGRIAGLMNATQEKRTPLQVSLDNFSKKLAVVIMIISALVFILGLYRQMPVLDSLMFAVALAVAAIPEALSSIVTIVQAMGTQKMARENAIIKQLKAVESLGCVSVICSDKTGTLTQNKMTVQQIYIDGKVLKPEELDLKQQLHRYLLYNAILTNDSSLVDGKGIGDPTEYALLEMARKANAQDEVLREVMPRVEEIPFDSDRKLMSTKYLLHGQPTVLTKGALDVLLPRCTKIRDSEEIRPMAEADREQILHQNLMFSENGLRVLAFGYKEVEHSDELSLESENDYIFLGLISMIDPPREESRLAVADAKRAGIRPVMITGDHKITATAIAKQIGIFEEGDLAVTGTELDAMTDAQLDEKIAQISVYARVSPENKIRIVDAWQRRGNIVSMTGDGVNDAPALKKADIGVAMGITGTEVSKDAASMILADDNFATIIKAVANGRNVYRNIKNAIQFLLSGNMAAILAVLYTSLLALPVPFAPVHLLFINLLTDSLPALAIGMEPPEKDLLSQKPRDPKEGILSGKFMLRLLLQGGLISVCVIAAFYIGLNTQGAAVASTMAFATLTLARLFHGFNCRSEHSIFRLGFKGNWYSLGAFAAGALLLACVIFLPFLHGLFEVADLTGAQMGLVLLLAVIPTAVIQLVKFVKEH